jgi:hypothetical protein
MLLEKPIIEFKFSYFTTTAGNGKMALYIHYSEVAMAALSRQVWKLGTSVS